MEEEYVIQPNNEEVEVQDEPESVAPENGTDAIDEKAEINRLLDEGYTAKQIIDLGFKRRTVYYYAKKRVKPEGTPVSSNGHMSQATLLPAKLDGKQVIVPEYLIKHLSFIDGDKKQVAIDMILIWEAARRSVMEDVMILQGLTTAQAQTTETQLRILREAKSESREIAQAAAEQAAQMVGGQVHEILHQAAKPESPNPFASMMSQTMQPYLSQVFSRMFGMFGGFGQAPGMVPPQPGQPDQQGQVQGQPVSFGTTGRQISKQEMEAVFDDE
ncbi:hypothetical protein ACFLW6_01160 [Chloroflexota bacterium]